MILIFDYFETLVHNVSMDFNRALKVLWEKYYADKCSFAEIASYGNEIFDLIQSKHSSGDELAFIRDELPMYAERFGGNVISLNVNEEMEFLMNCNEMELMPEIAETLAEIEKMGIRMYVLSNSEFTGEALLAILDRLGIGKYFEKVWSSADFGKVKPDRTFFEMAIQDVLKDNPGEIRETIMFIGDTYESDIVGAANAGIKPIWINSKNGKNTKNIELQYISEIKELVGAMGSAGEGDIDIDEKFRTYENAK